jgi:hypothetical protein
MTSRGLTGLSICSSPEKEAAFPLILALEPGRRDALKTIATALREGKRRRREQLKQYNHNISASPDEDFLPRAEEKDELDQILLRTVGRTNFPHEEPGSEQLTGVRDIAFFNKAVSFATLLLAPKDERWEYRLNDLLDALREFQGSAEARRRNIRFIAYNTRFLILPWIRVPHLASHILGRVTRALPGDWERMYSHPIYFAETFIDPGRFRGTCYRAANWVLMGRTTGRGKASNSWIPNRSIKEVLGLALTRRFRELLSE